MKELDVEGLFWPAANPDDRVAGRLRFDVASGAELDLIGSFGGPERILAADEAEIRILGVAGKRMLTLDGCLQAGSTLEVPGIHRTRYRPSLILSGAHFDEHEALDFSAISVQVRHLEHWVRRSGAVFKMVEDQARRDIKEISVTYTPVEQLTVSSALGELDLGFTWKVRGDHVVESAIDQGCYVRLRPSQSESLDELVKVAMAVQHVVTLAVDVPAPITTISLEHPDVTRTLPSGRTVHEQIELYAELQGGDAPPYAGHRHAHEMLFTFDDLGGIPGLARWLEVSQSCEPVIGALLSHQYMPRMYAENRLQNIVFAAETFHRIRFPNRIRPKGEFRQLVSDLVRAVPNEWQRWLREQLQYSNEPRLKQRLLDLAGYAGDTFTNLVGDVNKWAENLKDVRNRSVHRSAARVDPGGPSMFYLAESAYFLVALCLLRDCGVSSEALAKIRDHQRYKWLAAHLRE